MTTLRSIFFIIIFTWLSSMMMEAGSAMESKEELAKVGFAERDISPEIGMEIPGGYGKVFHQKFHDPCKVRTVVLEDGSLKVALVGVDALIVPRSLVEAVRREIHEKCHISPEAVMIGASHSHSSGPIGMVQPGEFDFATPFVKSLAYEKSSCADPKYLEQVRQAIVEAVCRADAIREPARCGVGKGIEDKAAFNRRFRMKNGLVYTHPGKGNPDIVGVAGPIDPEVGVMGVWNREGKFLGCIVNYACHATTSPDGISANWIYYLEKVIRGALGSDAVVVFLQGFCGDVTQVDNLSRYAERPGEDSAKYVGGRVGVEAVKVLWGMAQGTLVPLQVQTQLLKLPHRIPDPERVKRCEEIVKKDMGEVGHTEWTFAKEIVLLNAALTNKPTAEAEVQAVQIGPAVFLSAPGEMFCQFGLDLKARCHFPFTFPVELANGCVGYVPTEEALGEHGGGYETRLTSYSNLTPDAGRKMIDAALELAKGMKPGVVPTLPPAQPFKEPWSYGNVPPELK